jgi:hypothetical protein
MRLRLLGLIDVLLVTDPDAIRWLNAHPDVVRPPDSRAGLLQWYVNRQTRTDLAFEGSILPVFLSRLDLSRARRQSELADALDEPARVPSAKSDWLGSFVAGLVSEAETASDSVGVYVQQWCGRLFDPRFQATSATYAAGRMIASWPSSPPWRKGGRARKRLDEAKRTLAAAAGHDVHCVHATSIGGENVTRSIRNMQALAAKVGLGTISAEQAMRQCLVVPPLLVRGCEREIRAPFLETPLTRRSLVVFLLAKAYAKSGDLDLAFLNDTWSACPARHVVPSMLQSVWNSAIQAKANQDTGWEKLRRATGIAKSVLRVVNGAAERRQG